MRLDLNKLRLFREVVRTGSYSAAADRLHVTASAVSHSIGRLRESLGCELFEWRGKRFSLTKKGDYLYQVCQRVFDDLEEADLRICAGADEPVYHFVLGSTIEFGTTVLLPRIRPFLLAHPTFHIDFHFSNELMADLLHDEIDLAVDCREYSHPAVHRHRMFREKYVIVAAPGFLRKHPIRTPLDLNGTPVLSLDREGTWWNHLISTLPMERRPLLEHIIVIDNIRGMINGATAEYGVGLLPKYSVLNELSSGELIALFPHLKLLEDAFSIYQKLTRMQRHANRIVNEFLLSLDIRDFGDAIGSSD